MTLEEFFNEYNNQETNRNRKDPNNEIDPEEYNMIFRSEFYQHFEYTINDFEINHNTKQIIFKAKTKENK